MARTTHHNIRKRALKERESWLVGARRQAARSDVAGSEHNGARRKAIRGLFVSGIGRIEPRPSHKEAIVAASVSEWRLEPDLTRAKPD
jgi:hypothetical protein